MLIGQLSINVDFFEGWTFEKFKDFHESHNWKETTGKSAEQCAKILKVGKIEKPIEE